MASVPIGASKSRCTIRLVNYRRRKLPTDSAEDPLNRLGSRPNAAQAIDVAQRAGAATVHAATEVHQSAWTLDQRREDVGAEGVDREDGRMAFLRR